MFIHLTDCHQAIDMSEVVIQSSQKINHGKFHPHYRGSIYRGVSRNGKSWQVLIMIDSEKVYLVSTDDPQQAALLYDIVVIQAKGLNAKVNFSYTKEELLGILFTQSLLEIKKLRYNIDEMRQMAMFNQAGVL